MRANDHLKIGVLGGMGPEASAKFYLRIVQLFQSELQARHNFDYPEMLIHNIPSPDNVEAGVGDELRQYLLDSVALLEAASMEMLAIPCNSAHVHIDAVAEAASTPVMNILEETAKEIGRSGNRRVLLLGTKSTLDYNIYPPYLERFGITVVLPKLPHQHVVTRAIMAVCDGSLNENTRNSVLSVITSYPDIDGVVLGCTELPAIVSQKDMAVQCFDTLELLARATVERSRNTNC